MRPAIKYIKENLGLGLVGAEIGVDLGSHASEIYINLPMKELFLIDPWIEYKQVYQNNLEISMIVRRGDKEYMKVLERFSNKPEIKIFRLTSVTAATAFPDRKFDFVYIDGCHNTDSVIDDIAAWLPKIKFGGVLAGHDYETWESVRLAVDKALPESTKKDNDWWICI